MADSQSMETHQGRQGAAAMAIQRRPSSEETTPIPTPTSTTQARKLAPVPRRRRKEPIDRTKLPGYDRIEHIPLPSPTTVYSTSTFVHKGRTRTLVATKVGMCILSFTYAYLMSLRMLVVYRYACLFYGVLVSIYVHVHVHLLICFLIGHVYRRRDHRT